MYPHFEVPVGSVIPVPFATYSSAGASVTLTGLAVTDIEVYKLGAGVTQRSSDAGYALIDTDGIDIDGVTGIHGFTIDTSDNTDAGFYAAGTLYHVVVSAVTVDSQTVNFIACSFRLRAAENTAGVQTVDTVRVSNTTQTARDLGASVLLSSGTGTGQVSLSAGVVAANPTQWNGTNIPAVHTAGYPIVTIKDGTGTGEIDTASGKVSLADGSIAAATFAAGALDANALATDAVAEITAAIKALVIETEGSITVGQALSSILASAAGVTGTGGSVFKSPNGVATRITATVNGSNERTAITLTPSA